MNSDVLAYWIVFLRGAGWTVALSCLALVLGLLAGFAVALLRISPLRVLQWTAICYTELFRSLPTLVMLFFSYFGLSYFFDISVSPFAAATIALTLLASSLLSEVIRAAIQSVGSGQWLAAYANGMRPVQAFRFIIAPQAVRVMMAPTVGVYIATLKDSSLAAIVGYVELMKSGLLVRDATGDSVTPLLIVAALYFVINYFISAIGLMLERKFGVML